MISPISSNGRLKLNNELIEVRIPMLDVDVVVLWVDGNDPDWLAEKGKYDAKESVDSNGSFHFRDYGLMKYWFRAVPAPEIMTMRLPNMLKGRNQL